MRQEANLPPGAARLGPGPLDELHEGPASSGEGRPAAQYQVPGMSAVTIA